MLYQPVITFNIQHFQCKVNMSFYVLWLHLFLLQFSKSIIYFELDRRNVCFKFWLPVYYINYGRLEFLFIFEWHSLYCGSHALLKNTHFFSGDVIEAVQSATAFMDYFPWHFCCSWKQTKDRKTKGERENCGITDNDTPLVTQKPERNQK